MFPVTVTLHNATQLQAVLAALNSGDAPALPTPAAAPAKQEASAEKKPKAQASTSAKTQATPAPTEPTAGAVADAAPESKGENSDAAQGGNDEGAWNTQDGYKDTPEYQEVAKAVVAVAKAQGREAAAELLEKTAGVKSLPESKPSQAAAIIAAFQG
ncbi:hypothetical protein G3T20_05705 [Bordetella hinzii]|uniref:hypothetical protein n=1 Tax=Bordetella hinzii TaxID=103855 RepID=UPI0013EFF7DA|nr:hypothetical protein [Bordetella hinzii]QII84239.1 hypothetical protein G3T20_05705 [Bordetella hinzii]